MNRMHVTCGHVATAPAAGAGVGAAAVAAVRHLPGLDSTVSLVRVQIYTAQDFPALCQPYASLHTASSQIAARRRVTEEANLACTRCVHSKLALFGKAPEGTGSKNTVCLPSLKPNTIIKISYFERFVTFTLCVCPSV